MHILIGILTLVGGIAFWVWRTRNAASVAREFIDVADDARAALRRFGYRRVAGKHPLDVVEDSRLAAAGILVAFAKMDGDYTREQMKVIQEECARVFEASDKDAEQMTAYGRWLAHQLANPDEVIRRLSRGLAKSLSNAQSQELLVMAERVAAVEGDGPSDEQSLALKRLSETFAVLQLR